MSFEILECLEELACKLLYRYFIKLALVF